MADVTPNYALESERIKLEVSQLELNIQSQKFRIMQIEDEKLRIQENINATDKSIAKLQDQLKAMKVE